MSADPPLRRRTVRSFVRRAGRVTDAQARALQHEWPRFGLEYSSEPLALERLFGRTAACTLDIGFGNGEQLLNRARLEPHRNFLGVEVHRAGVGQLLNAAATAGLGNLRLIIHDAVEVLQWQLQEDSLDEVQILFPDPWPKKRHHKRRLIQPAFLALLASRLRPGGRLWLATDWAPYALQMQEVIAADPHFSATIAPIAEATARVATRFEQRGLRLGHEVTELHYVRTA